MPLWAGPVFRELAGLFRKTCGLVDVLADAFIRELLAKPKLWVIGTEHDLGKLAGDSQAAEL
jgi:hypothetical protein